MSFKDYFSDQAAAYAKFRPKYPPALFEYLANVAPDRKRAWDAGTGNGQAAVGLAGYFEKVLATDASEKQIAHAMKHERVDYAVRPAEDSGCPADSLDLVTAAQAVHWFRMEAFFAEVGRVLKPGGVVAVWSYDVPRVAPEVDSLIKKHVYDPIAPHWSPEARLVADKYKSIPFPFPEVPAPVLTAESWIRLEELLGYLGTWSALRTYVEKTGHDPRPALRQELKDVWGNPQGRRRLLSPLHLRVGQKPA